MAKKQRTHNHFHWIHLVAAFILGGYYIISKINLTSAFLQPSLVRSFLQLFIFGLLFSYIFLYIFSHEKFFPFAKDIEKQEHKSEKKLLKKYMHHSKILATFLIGIIGGPIFLSLTIRFLLNNFKHKYIFIFVTSFISSLLTFGIGKGFINILFRI